MASEESNGSQNGNEVTEEVVRFTRKQSMAIARATKAFTGYKESRQALARIAKAIVNLRLTFEKDGKPDFRGETPQYRGAVAQVYAEAIPDHDERAGFKVAVRYWVMKELTARVKAGTIKASDLEEAGIMKPSRERQNGNGSLPRELRTGVTAHGHALDPQQVLEESERVIEEHVSKDTLGPVVALQAITRQLGPIVAALRDEDSTALLPKRSLREATTKMLGLSLDAAAISGLDVDDIYERWTTANQEAVAA